ncbi:hypothetical protein FHS16_001008 [Paenibacillus endophyticus]|uniref:Uncharacterized protein n=1 Tax=Paenibacillus endophyticus TaxID=1294268 RepID=A0A7W5C5B4_9BACL|nr:hypothetical protein [Paenibacillus endophyticus]MBB3150974.1 hypothetical protein [Paenibacillus endophyticus]
MLFKNLFSKWKLASPVSAPIEKALLVIDSTPDLPQEFGYKCQWFAVNTTDTERVAAFLKGKGIIAANWKTGMAAAYNGSCFITPQVNGWTFIIQPFMREIEDSSSEGARNKAQALSALFGEAYYFGNYRVSSYYAWCKAINGHVVRAFGYGDGEVLIDEGDLTAEEHQIAFFTTGDEEGWLSEEDVLTLAELWTTSTVSIDGDCKPGTGFLVAFD